MGLKSFIKQICCTICMKGYKYKRVKQKINAKAVIKSGSEINEEAVIKMKNMKISEFKN